MCIYCNDHEESPEDDATRATTNEATSADEALNRTTGGVLSRIKASIVAYVEH
jgi:hypothetical protein